MEHDFYVGIGLAIVLTYLVKTQGPAYTAEYAIVIIKHPVNTNVINMINSFSILGIALKHLSLRINKQLDEEEAALKAIRQDEIDACLASVPFHIIIFCFYHHSDVLSALMTPPFPLDQGRAGRAGAGHRLGGHHCRQEGGRRPAAGGRVPQQARSCSCCRQEEARLPGDD